MKNVLESILEEIEERVGLRERLVKYEERRGTITDACRNKGALEELDIIARIIRSRMGEVAEDWIPVEKRLPEEPKYIEDSYIVQQENVIDPFSAYWDGKEWTDTNDEPIKRVIAWQPLPKRYKPNKK